MFDPKKPKKTEVSGDEIFSDERRARAGRSRWLLKILGFFALLWFLIRVVPKPSRARYPCQRIAFPIASGFVVWAAAAVGSLSLLRKARRQLRRARYIGAAALLAVVVGVLWMVGAATDSAPAMAAPPPVNQPAGEAKGIHPGRVVWAHDPGAVNWAGPETGMLWYQHIDQEKVNRMLAESVKGLTGQKTLLAAWDALFHYFNRAHGNGDVGYRKGEKIAIKINMTLCTEGDTIRMGKSWDYADRIDNSPQLTIALLKQLVDQAGVPAQNICIGDPSRIMPNYYYNMVSNTPGLEDVIYLTRYGSPASGRKLVQYSDERFHWSDPDAQYMQTVSREDFLPVSFAEADYMVNFAVLKTHSLNGITLCAKNHFGSLIRNPSPDNDKPWYRGSYDMHRSLAGSVPGMGHYRCLVDLMGHRNLGGKTILYMIDGLIAGHDWEGIPERWRTEPFNGDWPNSILISQDPVAIDSVGFDFLYAEWPDGYANMDGVLDYLQEAALASAPPSGAVYDPDGDGKPLASLGVHEHWNNAHDRQYSRNLGAGEGIELLALETR